MKATLAFSLRIVSFITIPAAVGLMVLREPIIRVLFEHGQFVAESTELTARALFYYAFGLPAFAAIRLIVPAFYSTHDTRTPVLVAAFTLALNMALNLLFLHWLFSTFRNGGPAFATVVAAYFNFFTLFVIFRVRYGRLGTSRILLSVARIALCAGLMGGMCWMALRLSHFNSYQRVSAAPGSLRGFDFGRDGGLSRRWHGFSAATRCRKYMELRCTATAKPATAPGLPG